MGRLAVLKRVAMHYLSSCTRKEVSRNDAVVRFCAKTISRRAWFGILLVTNIVTLALKSSQKEMNTANCRASLRSVSYLSQFRLSRNVTIRETDWSGGQPLQIYKGASVPAAASMSARNWEEDSFLEVVRRNSETLSQSARTMLPRYPQMTEHEKQSFRMKVTAETRASQPLNAKEHLHILYLDEHICVVNKPSGILSVPGPRRNPSLADLVYDIVSPATGMDVDKMVVHRLDMDTSGILVFALTETALRYLHDDFRSRRVKKVYEALLVGHLHATEVEIDVALERDPHHPPFMRIAKDPKSKVNIDAVHPGFRKFIEQAPKPSLTELRVISHECLGRAQVTRVELAPHTGRTHQLRVHTASQGYPIVGDDIYGFQGEGDCGADTSALDAMIPNRLDFLEEIFAMKVPLCLHARRLCLYHPFSGAPMVFECQSPF